MWANFVITPLKLYQKPCHIPLLHTIDLIAEWKHHHRYYLGWTQPSISIVMHVQKKIHARLHYHLCANGNLMVLSWNWTKFMYVFIKPLKKTNYFLCCLITSLSLQRKNYMHACSWFETIMLNSSLNVVWSLSTS